jgi:hypothetical protein
VVVVGLVEEAEVEVAAVVAVLVVGAVAVAGLEVVV